MIPIYHFFLSVYLPVRAILPGKYLENSKYFIFYNKERIFFKLISLLEEFRIKNGTKILNTFKTVNNVLTQSKSIFILTYLENYMCMDFAVSLHDVIYDVQAK